MNNKLLLGIMTLSSFCLSCMESNISANSLQKAIDAADLEQVKKEIKYLDQLLFKRIIKKEDFVKEIEQATNFTKNNIARLKDLIIKEKKKEKPAHFINSYNEKLKTLSTIEKTLNLTKIPEEEDIETDTDMDF